MRPRSPLLQLLSMVFSLSAIAAMAGCSSDGGGFVSDDGPPTPDQQDEIEAFIGTELPESTSADDIRAELIRGGPDDAVKLRLALPPQDVQPFLDRVGFDQPLRDAYRGVPAGGNGQADWFRTDELTEFQGAKTDGDRALQVTVDVSDPERSVVYLQVFEL